MQSLTLESVYSLYKVSVDNQLYKTCRAKILLYTLVVLNLRTVQTSINCLKKVTGKLKKIWCCLHIRRNTQVSYSASLKLQNESAAITAFKSWCFKHYNSFNILMWYVQNFDNLYASKQNLPSYIINFYKQYLGKCAFLVGIIIYSTYNS